MKIGMTIEPYEGISTSNLILLAKAIALNHIEININSISEIDKIIENIGKITTTFHLPIYGTDSYDLGSTNPNLKEEIRKVISCINNNYKNLNMIYTLAHPPESSESTIDKLLESLHQIETPIVLENIPWQKDEEFMVFYLKAKDVLGKKLAGHAIDASHRFLTYYDKWLDIPQDLKKEIVHVHLQDTTRNRDDHLPLGQGVLPYNDFIQFLKSLNYKGVINQEIKPKGLDIDSIMNSCLNIAKEISLMKYVRLKSRYAFVKPILRKKINQLFKNK